MTDLEIIRSNGLNEAIEKDPEKAGEFSLLKWGKENRSYLYNNPDMIMYACGLCIRYNDKHCTGCPLVIDNNVCDKQKTFQASLQAAQNRDRKEFEKQADLFLEFMRGHLGVE